jgi:hypothetical protein
LNASFLRRPPRLRSLTSVANESTWRSKFPREAHRQGIKVAQPTLPEDDHSPSRNFKFTLCSSIARHVTLELALPELGTRLGDVRQPAVVAVPKAAVHKEGDTPAPEDDIGFSGKLPCMEPKSVAHCVQEPANGHLRSRVAASDTAHEDAALGRAHDVGPHTRLASARNRW